MSVAARWLVAVCLSVCTLGAQSLLEVPHGPLAPGKQIEVKVDDPSRANKIVVVKIDNGDPIDPVVVAIEIVLDEHGQGSAIWSVPLWFEAYFMEEHSETVRRVIAPFGRSVATRTAP